MSLGRDVVILTCAVSAGIHAALVPAHGASFVVAAAALAAVVLALTLRPAGALPLAAAALVLAGLIGSYALAVTTGLPLVHPGPEPVDGLALAAKAIEAAGLAAAGVSLRRRRAPAAARSVPVALVGLVVTFSALATLALSGGHHAHATASDVRTGAEPTRIPR